MGFQERGRSQADSGRGAGPGEEPRALRYPRWGRSLLHMERGRSLSFVAEGSAWCTPSPPASHPLQFPSGPSASGRPLREGGAFSCLFIHL